MFTLRVVRTREFNDNGPTVYSVNFVSAKSAVAKFEQLRTYAHTQKLTLNTVEGPQLKWERPQ